MECWARAHERTAHGSIQGPRSEVVAVKTIRFRTEKPIVVRRGSTSVPPVGISRGSTRLPCVMDSTKHYGCFSQGSSPWRDVKCAISISVIIPDCPSGESGSTPLWRVTA